MQPMNYAPPPQPAKKSNVWLWVLGGCGAITVVGIIAVTAFVYFAYYAASRAIDEVSKNPVRTAAKLIELANPDIEVVSVDEDKKLVTFREKKTGTTTTVSLEEFERQAGGGSASRDDDSTAQGGDGKPSKSSGSDVGISDRDNIPAWVVLYPGAKVIAKITSGSADKVSGSLTLRTTDTVDAVFKFYESKLDGTGFTVTRAAAGGYRAINAKRDSGENLTVMAFAIEDDDDAAETNVTLTYSSQ